MKTEQAVMFNSDWEYRKARQQERKQDRKKRDERRGKKDTWQALESEAA